MSLEERGYYVKGGLETKLWDDLVAGIVVLGLDVSRVPESVQASLGSVATSPVEVVNSHDFHIFTEPTTAGRSIATRSWKCLTNLYAGKYFPEETWDTIGSYEHVCLKFQTIPLKDRGLVRQDRFGNLERPSLHEFVQNVNDIVAASRSVRLAKILGRKNGIGTLRFLNYFCNNYASQQTSAS